MCKERDVRTAAHGGYWGEGVSRSVMLAVHRREGPALCVRWGLQGLNHRVEAEDCRVVTRG